MRNAVRDFDSCTSFQAEHENRSLKAPGGAKPQQNIHRYAVAMVNKADHRYQVKSYVSGRDIVVPQLWGKSIIAQSLTRIAQGLFRAQVTSKNNYFVKSMSQLLFLVVANKVKLNPNSIPGGRPQIIRLRLCNLKLMEAFVAAVNFWKGQVLCADISRPSSTCLMHLWWMCAVEELLVFISESQCMQE
jgi:hypothetical protein